MCLGIYINHPLLFSAFNKIWILLTDFRRILKYHTSRKFDQWEQSCSVRTGRHDKTVAFHCFSNAPKNHNKPQSGTPLTRFEPSMWCTKGCSVTSPSCSGYCIFKHLNTVMLITQPRITLLPGYMATTQQTSSLSPSQEPQNLTHTTLIQHHRYTGVLISP